MTIVTKPVTDPPDDPNDGVGLELANQGNPGLAYAFSDIGWSRIRKNVDDLNFFNAVMVTGATGMVQLKGTGEGESEGPLITNIVPGDYLAYDSYVVWHIPVADWNPEFIIDGQQIADVYLDLLIDE